MIKKYDATEKQVVTYIKNQTEHSKIFKQPISQIAQETGSSTSTVWRVIQRLQDKRTIKIVKSKSVTEPDIIYYLGEEDEASPLIDQIKDYMESTSVLVQELSKQLVSSQEVIDDLKYKLEKYKLREEKFLNMFNKED